MTKPPIDETHEPTLKSWVESANGGLEFPIQNLPYGIFSPPGEGPRVGVAIGDKILDLRAAAEERLLPARVADAVGGTTLNALLGLALIERLELRRCLSWLLSKPVEQAQVEPLLYDSADCSLHLPAAIGDYTDFYVGIHHANNVGRQFRPDNPLLPNYKYVPIGYHGRASTVRPSGVPVVRPKGQSKAPDMAAPEVGPSRRLDHEVELGVWIGPGSAIGDSVPIDEAPRHIAGFCLLNDWSARDIQAWEYQPLGPFLSKNFHTTISPWIVTAEALAPFWIAQPPRPEGDPQPLPYLLGEEDQRSGALAVTLEAYLTTASMRKAGAEPFKLSRSAASNMYWTVGQMLAHHTSNGCDLNPGDLLGTGTISGPAKDGFGSLLEITRGGTEPLALPNGEVRTFIEDGDELILTGRAEAEGYVSIGFGPCRAAILPAR